MEKTFRKLKSFYQNLLNFNSQIVFMLLLLLLLLLLQVEEIDAEREREREKESEDRAWLEDGNGSFTSRSPGSYRITDSQITGRSPARDLFPFSLVRFSFYLFIFFYLNFFSFFFAYSLSHPSSAYACRRPFCFLTTSSHSTCIAEHTHSHTYTLRKGEREAWNAWTKVLLKKSLQASDQIWAYKSYSHLESKCRK